MENTNESNAIAESTFNDLLRSALSDPGVISSAYTAFYGYSIGNQMLAYIQCQERGITPGPIATFKTWQERGRYVVKGSKALSLCMPITCKRKGDSSNSASADSSNESAEPGAVFTRFVFRRNWFVLSQTDGAAFDPVALPEWNEDRALAALAIDRVPFDLTDGNCQGFARDRVIAVSPIAEHPHKTTIHEIAHIVLGHTAESGAALTDSERTPRSLREVEAESVAYIVCSALNLPGSAESRGYIQHWNESRSGEPIPEASARKIFKAANAILTAGRPAVASASADSSNA